MKKISYILWPFIFICVFIFHSFKGINKGNQTPKSKVFNLINDVNINMIWVTPGTFIMGSPSDELGRTPERETQHEVKITKGYWLAETELTQTQWEKIMGSNPSLHKGENLPVDQVSFDDIQKFLKKVNTNKNEFRLPTETEWEYACRAGVEKAYSGNRNSMVWHSGNSGRQSQFVGLKEPNAWGFYDMQGNILEWCSDWFQENNTNNTLNPKGPEAGTHKVQRGGQFTGRTKHTRAADPQRAESNKRDFMLGFEWLMMPLIRFNINYIKNYEL